jgi:hypothetical protein
VQNLKRAGVDYRALKGAAGNIEIGLIRPRDDEAQAGNRFVAVLKEVTPA